MKFAVVGEHRFHFETHQNIEFEELLSKEQIDALNHAIDQTLDGRDPFTEGRDLWRNNSIIKQTVANRRLAEIAGQLVDKRPIRIGYVQLLEKGSYSHWSEPVTLRDIAPFQGIVCGLFLCLEESEKEETSFPVTPGSGLFVDPNQQIDFTKLPSRYVLITYLEEVSLYIARDKDPLVHYLKSFGYNYGDRLLNTTHPLIYR